MSTRLQLSSTKIAGQDKSAGSVAVRTRLAEAGTPFRCNDNVASAIEPGDLEAMTGEVEFHMRAILAALVIDTDNDPNTQHTARRYARMMVNEAFRGRYVPTPAATDFPDNRASDEPILVGPIVVRSICAHHLCPIEGHVWCAVIPNGRLLGLSKFARLADWIMSRPQIQEEAVEQLADVIEQQLAPKGIAVMMAGTHTCMTWRGVHQEAAVMSTSTYRGTFKPAHMRTRFLSLIDAHHR